MKEFNDSYATCDGPRCNNALIEPGDILSGTCSEDCAIEAENALWGVFEEN